MDIENSQRPKQALLVSVYKGQEERDVCQEHLDELALLSETYGVEVADKIQCQLRKYTASTFVTQGKLDELIARAKELKVDLVVFDDEIAPSQQRNLEEAFGLTVMDRTEIILEVFNQRAHTREAKLQVELARLKYQLPRLKRLWTHLGRQTATGGSGAYTKGMGEKQIEVDRRLLRNRITQLEKEIRDIHAHRKTQRAQRQRMEVPTFALIGYTNAGKSTLMKALTEADVFIEDKLFATLDTTTRKFSLENRQDVLLIDTVGFIRKLPHLLVAAFRSTLEEAVEADILLHVIDISHPDAEKQAETTLEVLEELGAVDKPVVTILNKMDQCEDEGKAKRMRIKYTRTVPVSAKEKKGFENLVEVMIAELAKMRREVVLRIPQSEYGNVNKVLRMGKVHHQDYDENDVVLKAEIPVSLLGQLSQYVVSE